MHDCIQVQTYILARLPDVWLHAEVAVELLIRAAAAAAAPAASAAAAAAHAAPAADAADAVAGLTHVLVLIRVLMLLLLLLLLLVMPPAVSRTQQATIQAASMPLNRSQGTLVSLRALGARKTRNA